MIVCPNCQFSNAQGATFCKACGTFLDWHGPPPDPTPPPTPAGTPTSAPPAPPGPTGAPPAAGGTRQPPGVHMEETTLAVDPGGEVIGFVDVLNRSAIVDQYTVEVLDVPPEWVEIQPPSLSLFPDDRGRVEIRFRPPRASSVTPGGHAFRIAGVSAADPAVKTTVDGVLEVGAFTELAAELMPHTSRGRRAGRHHLEIVNSGNDTMRAVLTGRDADGQLTFRFRPDIVTVAAGAKSRAEVAVRPKRWSWFGSSRHRSFDVLVRGEEAEPITVSGTIEQLAVFPRWAPRAVPALLGVGVAAFILRTTVLAPKTENVGSSRPTTIPGVTVQNTVVSLPPVTLDGGPPTTPVGGAGGPGGPGGPGGQPTTVPGPATTAPSSPTTRPVTTTTTATTIPRVVFASFRQDGEQVWTMHPDGSNLSKLTSGGTYNTHASWRSDHELLAFVAGRHGNSEIYTMRPDGSEQRRITNNPANDGFPRWSPDGTKIAFVSNRAPDGAAFDIWVMDADGGNPVNRTSSPGVLDHKAVWSPDGTLIAWERGNEVWVMNATGPANGRMVATGKNPAWSPDGTKIAFSNGTNILTVSPDGGPTTSLTNSTGAENLDPWWAPDGSRIVFTSKRDGNEEIYIMRADGGAQTRITNNGANDRFAQM